MKHLSLILLLSLVITACENEAPNEVPNESINTSTPAVELIGEKKIDLEKSKIYWKGYKIMGFHSGTIQLSEGQIDFKDGNISSGSFTVDMNSVVVSDLMDAGQEEEEDEEPHDEKAELAEHLMDSDFFDAKQFPKATFVIQKVSLHNKNAYTITGDMTIKGIQQTLTFDAQLKSNIITATVSINRTSFGIKYGSGSFFSNLGDRAIKDEFSLDISLVLL
ncbi:YceI family protein [Aureispira anguillae]|uniref:YceI family protein n=1 Tax=Aureispira anguillae TaxID=2864201 RepID=A0A915YCT8_9BACT|nr:YceI family protein [Aureispira anguillae]BDS10717.1 YceI family protein [Aureispira anguillae]